jgi:hypothetical protein
MESTKVTLKDIKPNLIVLTIAVVSLAIVIFVKNIAI